MQLDISATSVKLTHSEAGAERTRLAVEHLRKTAIRSVAQEVAGLAVVLALTDGRVFRLSAVPPAEGDDAFEVSRVDTVVIAEVEGDDAAKAAALLAAVLAVLS